MHARGYATSWRCAPRLSDDHALLVARLEAEGSAQASEKHSSIASGGGAITNNRDIVQGRAPAFEK